MSYLQKMQQEYSDNVKDLLNRLNDKSNLRPIVIDSNDVAQGSNKQVFLLSRIKQIVDYFEKRNHQIYVVLSQLRREQILNASINTPSLSSIANNSNLNTNECNSNIQALNRSILLELEKKNLIHFTPYKKVGAKRIVCDDDSYMLQIAVAKKAIIVSNDDFKRWLNHSDEFKTIIEERVLMYSFIDSTFMPAEDPLGKGGPSLENFLRIESVANQYYLKRCPYKKKCTYGAKCRFWHPERGTNQATQSHQNIIDEANENKLKLEIVKQKCSSESVSQTDNGHDFNNRNQIFQQPFQSNISLLNNKSSALPHKYLRSMGMNSETDSMMESTASFSKKLQITNKSLADKQLFEKLIADDYFLKSLIEKCKASGFSWELIRETLRRRLLQAPPFEIKAPNTVNFKMIINDDEFIQELMDSIQTESPQVPIQQSSSGSIINNTFLNDVCLLGKRARLAAKFNDEIADKVLNMYTDETEIEKLEFLAEGLLFDL